MPGIALLHFSYLYFHRPLRSAYDLNIFYKTGHLGIRPQDPIHFVQGMFGWLPHSPSLLCHKCGKPLFLWLPNCLPLATLVAEVGQKMTDKWDKRQRKCGMPQLWLQPNTCLTFGKVWLQIKYAQSMLGQHMSYVALSTRSTGTYYNPDSAIFHDISQLSTHDTTVTVIL